MPVDTQALDGSRRWVTSVVAAPELMQTLQDDLPVRLIATPRQDLRTCHMKEPLGDVVERNLEAFDFFPVVDGLPGETEHIVGLVELAPFTQTTTPNVRVEDRMEHLSEDNLIGADASILSFIKSADRQPCRLVVSGARIDGLVSLSDLQKLPVRAALFSLITFVEMAMAHAIRLDCPKPILWKKRLSTPRRAKLEEAVQSARKKNAWIEDLLLTQFADKVQIIRKSDAFRGSKSAFERTMKQIQKLRDGLAHANEYAYSRSTASAVCETVRQIEVQIDQLRTWPALKSRRE